MSFWGYPQLLSRFLLRESTSHSSAMGRNTPVTSGPSSPMENDKSHMAKSLRITLQFVLLSRRRAFLQYSAMTTALLFLILLASGVLDIRSMSRHLDDWSPNPCSQIAAMEEDAPSDCTLARAALSIGTNKRCGARRALKVWVYPLPVKYHFGLCTSECKTKDCYLQSPGVNASWDWTEPPAFKKGGMHKQHAVDYFLAADIMGPAALFRDPCASAAVRVTNPADADVFFVPFLSSVCTNMFGLNPREPGFDLDLQNDVADMVLQSPMWKRRGGMDHVVLAHHPNAFRVRLPDLAPATFVVADFARHNASVASVLKDVVAPYIHMVQTASSDSNPLEAWERRPTLLFFQGTVLRRPEFGGWVRAELQKILETEPRVRFVEGTHNTTRQQFREGMRTSRFCLHLVGDTPSSVRLFDAIASHCVPVIISDHLELPFEDTINYRDFAIFMSAEASLQPRALVSRLENVSRWEWTAMWQRLRQVEHHFQYQYPSQPGDAVDMTWHSIQLMASKRRFAWNRQSRLTVPEWVEGAPL